MRKHGGPPSGHDKQSRWRRSALPVLPGAALLGATSHLPSSRAEPILVPHRGNARGNHGAPLQDRVHLPTSLSLVSILYFFALQRSQSRLTGCTARGCRYAKTEILCYQKVKTRFLC